MHQFTFVVEHWVLVEVAGPARAQLVWFLTFDQVTLHELAAKADDVNFFRGGFFVIPIEFICNLQNLGLALVALGLHNVEVEIEINQLLLNHLGDIDCP